jgi:hypothetical protein
MESEELRDQAPNTEQAASAQFADESSQGEVRAWEEVDAGRYMPRRIKGSCKGRALG